MLIIGIAGQAGSGKSAFAEMLSKLGFGENLEVDAVGHQVLARPSFQKKLCSAFGDDILVNGSIDRKILGKKAFASKEATALLNSIMHPAMKEIVEEKINEARSKKASSIIINAALLYTMKLDPLCTHCIYVSADPELRLARLVEKRKWTEESARTRLFAQDKAPASPDLIRIENNGTEAELLEAAEGLKKKLL